MPKKNRKVVRVMASSSAHAKQSAKILHPSWVADEAILVPRQLKKYSVRMHRRKK